MSRIVVVLACLVMAAGCTETGDSPYTQEEAGDTVTPDTSGGVYWEHVEPILGRICGGCHTGGTSGGTNFANTYEDNLKPSYYCASEGKTVGECLPVRIDDGSMPTTGPSDITPGERDLLDTWIAAGMPLAAGAVDPEDVVSDTPSEDAATSDTSIEDTGPVEDVATGDAGSGDAGSGDAGSGDAGSGDAVVADTVEPPVPTWTDDVQPIIASYCGACHGASGGWSVDDYESTQKTAFYPFCGDMVKGECFSVRIKDESMPTAGGGGSILAEVEASGELAIIDAWIAGGMPE